MSFKNYLVKKLKYLFGVALTAGLLSQLLAPLLSVRADGPRFNFLQGDYQILEGVNSTKGDTVWKNPVSGVAGDEFRGSVYYHNGFQDTVAENTRIKVNIPSKTTNGTAKITASISADNAQTVTSTIVDGQLVGLDGLVMNLDKDSDIEFVPGSVQWFPNALSANGTPSPLPGGQSGNEIITSGVNIGNIQGCWQFAGFVTFKFRTKVKEVPQIQIEKTVRNISKDGEQFSKETLANPGDEVEFKIDVTNGGNIDIDDAVLKDILPGGLVFQSGSLKKVFGGNTTNLSDADAAKLFGAGLSLETLAPEGAKMIEFLFKAKTLTSLKEGNIETNKAIVTAKGMTKESTASVKIVEKKVPNIVESKSAYNDTKKQDAEKIAASRGDLITYKLITKNTGTGCTEVEIMDDISQILANAEVTSISDGGRVEGSFIKWPAINIQPGEEVTRTFVVKIKDVSANVCFINKYGNEVKVCVEVPAPVVTPCLHIEKLVRDVTTNESHFNKNNEAFAGDTLEYLVNFSNTGNGSADGVKFSDTLPPNTQYISGSTRISRNGGSEQTLPDGIASGGVSIDSIPAGETGFIKFRVITSGNLAAGENLVNTASISQGGKTLSDMAQTKIIAKAKEAAPVLPKTGSTGAASFIITFIAGTIFLYGRYRKALNSEETMIINSLLA